MIRFHTLSLVFAIALTIVAKGYGWTWFPDAQRGTTLEARWNRYRALPVQTQATVIDVCGPLGEPSCKTPFGRPPDTQQESCDRACCHAGYLTGFCHGKVEVGIKVVNPGSSSQTQYKPAINAGSGCVCTNNLIDAKCGPDGSFIGIRCPFDKSACARKCCREGKSGGHCGGFLSLKCKCD